MKLSFLIVFLLATINLFSQDYIIKPKGTKLDGEVISMQKNILTFKDKDGDLKDYKIDKLHIIHISNPNFKMKSVNLNNTLYEKDDNGIHIVMMDYEDKGRYISSKNSHSRGEGKSKSYSNSSSDKGSTNITVNAEINSSLSISSDDEGPKAKVILDCDDCSDNGTLIMVSEDKKTKLEWTFESNGGSVFPMEFELDSDKKYSFKYKDGNKQSIEKKVKIEEGVNIISVFQ